MKIAMIGLGRMGANMARRIQRAGIDVVGFSLDKEVTEELAREEGITAARSLTFALKKLPSPRIVWLMLPSGAPTEKVVKALADRLEVGDIVVDGGNSNYKDSQRRAAMLAQLGVGYVDCGTSGGVKGLNNGYCLMLGGERRHIDVLEPVLKVLAPAQDKGWAYVGPSGSGHYTKMVHNGIEYGMMQAMAEGFDLLKNKREFNYDLAEVAELWRHGSVVSSWLMDLTAEAFKEDQELADFMPQVSDSGEGRWVVSEAIDLGVAVPVISTSLMMRFVSQDDSGYGNRVLSMMRQAFGGHETKSAPSTEE